MNELQRTGRHVLVAASWILLVALAAPMSLEARELCLRDASGEQIHLRLFRGGLVTGYSEFAGTTVGTAFGSYKSLSRSEIMLGGDINSDCTQGFMPAKLNVRIDLRTLTGTASGFLFVCGNGAVIPFETAITPCIDRHGDPGPSFFREEKPETPGR